MSDCKQHRSEHAPFQNLICFQHLSQEGKGKLTDVINTEHEHVRYLPGIELPENLRATPDVCETVRDATAIVFCVVSRFGTPKPHFRDAPRFLTTRMLRAAASILGRCFEGAQATWRHQEGRPRHLCHQGRGGHFRCQRHQHQAVSFRLLSYSVTVG